MGRTVPGLGPLSIGFSRIPIPFGTSASGVVTTSGRPSESTSATSAKRGALPKGLVAGGPASENVDVVNVALPWFTNNLARVVPVEKMSRSPSPSKSAIAGLLAICRGVVDDRERAGRAWQDVRPRRRPLQDHEVRVAPGSDLVRDQIDEAVLVHVRRGNDEQIDEGRPRDETCRRRALIQTLLLPALFVNSPRLERTTTSRSPSPSRSATTQFSAFSGNVRDAR